MNGLDLDNCQVEAVVFKKYWASERLKGMTEKSQEGYEYGAGVVIWPLLKHQ
jgi:hypothetical protein